MKSPHHAVLHFSVLIVARCFEESLIAHCDIQLHQVQREKESIQIIIDFKWNSYAWKFFSVQLHFFTDEAIE
jgi:hypothetical protein